MDEAFLFIVIPGSKAKPSVNGDPAFKCREAAFHIPCRIPAFAGMTHKVEASYG